MTASNPWTGTPVVAIIDADALIYRCGFAAEERRYVATYGERSETFGKRRDAQEWLANASDSRTGQTDETSGRSDGRGPNSGLDRSSGSGSGSSESGDQAIRGLDSDAIPGPAVREDTGQPVLPTGREPDAGTIEYAPVAEPAGHACQSARTTIDSIRRNLFKLVGPHDAEFYISGKDNFRYALATLKPYKGNRKDVPKPIHYDALREFIQNAYGAKVVDGQEADDAVGIRATELCGHSIIVSNDKDLLTVPGLHFDWTKELLFNVTEREASRHFYCQLLSGDTTDNIPGIEGIGIVKAKRILGGFTTDKGMWQTVLAEYTKHYPDGFMGQDTRRAVIEIARLLYIRRHPNEQWSPP